MFLWWCRRTLWYIPFSTWEQVISRENDCPWTHHSIFFATTRSRKWSSFLQCNGKVCFLHWPCLLYYHLVSYFILDGLLSEIYRLCWRAFAGLCGQKGTGILLAYLNKGNLVTLVSKMCVCIYRKANFNYQNIKRIILWDTRPALNLN